MKEFNIPQIKFPFESIFGKETKPRYCKGGGGSFHSPTPAPVPVTSDAADVETDERKRLKKLKGMASTVLTKGLLEDANIATNKLKADYLG